ncbi:hypothetical protein ACDA55_37500, partial [Rhizobium ruizarguesonis]
HDPQKVAVDLRQTQIKDDGGEVVMLASEQGGFSVGLVDDVETGLGELGGHVTGYERVVFSKQQAHHSFSISTILPEAASTST